MSNSTSPHVIDVRPMPPRERHPLIFGTWRSLESGGTIELVNDHDPLPLYYQFATEHPGTFRWEYIERGPDTFRVLITKGDFPEPGFHPGGLLSHSCSRPRPTAPELKPFVLDTLPIFAAGDTPCDAIDNAVATLLPGQALVLLAPFEPVPLYAKLGNQGFSHHATQLDNGTWRIEFRPTEPRA